MSDRVTVSIAGGIADVKLNRADKRNALDNDMFLAIAEAGERLKTEPGVRVVVLSGDGPSFCAGLDFGSFQQMAGGERTERPDDGSPGSMHPFSSFLLYHATQCLMSSIRASQTS